MPIRLSTAPRMRYGCDRSMATMDQWESSTLTSVPRLPRRAADSWRPDSLRMRWSMRSETTWETDTRLSPVIRPIWARESECEGNNRLNTASRLLMRTSEGSARSVVVISGISAGPTSRLSMVGVVMSSPLRAGARPRSPWLARVASWWFPTSSSKH